MSRCYCHWSLAEENICLSRRIVHWFFVRWVSQWKYWSRPFKHSMSKVDFWESNRSPIHCLSPHDPVSGSHRWSSHSLFTLLLGYCRSFFMCNSSDQSRPSRWAPRKNSYGMHVPFTHRYSSSSQFSSSRHERQFRVPSQISRQSKHNRPTFTFQCFITNNITIHVHYPSIFFSHH
jgi:hypothetical protein